MLIGAFVNALRKTVKWEMRRQAEEVEDRKNTSPIFDWCTAGRNTTDPTTEPITEVFSLSEEDLPSNRHWNGKDLLIEEKEAVLASHFANLETKQKRY